MKDEQGILAEITDITSDIGADYPELYQFWTKILAEYLEDLRELLKHHLQTHKTDWHEKF